MGVVLHENFRESHCLLDYFKEVSMAVLVHHGELNQSFVTKRREYFRCEECLYHFILGYHACFLLYNETNSLHNTWCWNGDQVRGGFLTHGGATVILKIVVRFC